MSSKSKDQKKKQPPSIQIHIEQGVDSAHLTWLGQVIVGDLVGQWIYHAVTNVEIRWQSESPPAKVLRQVKIEIVKRVWMLNNLFGNQIELVNADFAGIWLNWSTPDYREGTVKTIERFV